MTTALIFYCNGVSKGTMVRFQQRDFPEWLMKEEKPIRLFPDRPELSKRVFFLAVYGDNFVNYPDNGVSLLRICRTSAVVAGVTALVFGVFFEITDRRYRRHLKTLEKLGLQLPDRTAIQTIKVNYLNPSTHSPIYETVVLDVLACSGAAAVPAVSEFMLQKLDQFDRERDHSAMLFVLRCARILSAIGDSAGFRGLGDVEQRRDAIRRRYLDGYQNDREREERENWLTGYFDEISRLKEKMESRDGQTREGEAPGEPLVSSKRSSAHQEIRPPKLNAIGFCLHAPLFLRPVLAEEFNNLVVTFLLRKR